MEDRRRALPLALGAALLAAQPLLAATHTWSGAVNGIWSNPGNWSLGGAPANGESNADLTFPAGQGSMGAMVNDVTSLDVSSMTFGDAYALGGNPLTIHGTIAQTDPGIAQSRVNLDLVLSADATFSTGPQNGLIVAGTVSGPHGVSVSGSLFGFVELAGANGYAGVTRLTSGGLLVSNPAALGAADGTAATGTVVSGGTLYLAAIVADENLVIGGSGSDGFGALRPRPNSNPVGWTGSITLTSDIWISNSFWAPMTFGPIGDQGAGYGPVFVGGRITLASDNTFTGTLTMQGGDVYVTGTNLAPFRMHSIAGTFTSFLRGVGSVAGITAGGANANTDTIAPGSGAGAGVLTSNGPVVLQDRSVLSVRITGTGSDRLDVNGTVDVTGARLSAQLVLPPPTGRSLTIIGNDGADPVTGTFVGLPEGATFQIGGAMPRLFAISYAGGDGNDVVLTTLGSGDSFYTLVPCRLVDTRRPAGPLGGPPLTTGTRTFALAGTCEVPPEARSLAVVTTVVAPSGDGELRLFSGGSSAPLRPTVTVRAGRTRAQGAIVEVSRDGMGSLSVSASLGPSGWAQLLLDVVGFYR